MAELVARPGAFALPWSGGPVNLPAALRSGDDPRGLRCSVERDGGRLLVSVDAPDSSTEREILYAVRAKLREGSVAREQPSDYSAEFPATVRNAPPDPPATDDDPLLRALASMDDRRGTVAELCERVGWSAKKTRMKLRSLQEAGRIAVERSGRAHVYALIDSELEPSREPLSRSQLELLSG